MCCNSSANSIDRSDKLAYFAHFRAEICYLMSELIIEICKARVELRYEVGAPARVRLLPVVRRTSISRAHLTVMLACLHSIALLLSAP